MLYVPLFTVSIAAAISAVSAYPIDGDGVHCRSGPGTGYSIVKTYGKGEDISITCQAPGTDVNGDSLWDKTSDGCYVTDYYVKTGSSGYVTSHCPSTGGGGGSGTGIVNAAEKEKGLPYVWGGGGCHGPSGGGFDCSGLTQYSICQALNKEIPRTAQTQYDSSLGKRLPRSEAKEGDLLFWAEGGDCKNSVSHVGIFIREGLMINAAHTGTPVREQSIWTSYGGESICPDVVRFW
ncbi:putative NlpC/P60-like cell-wall peptidase [Talaromyces proteolyticus]|uniref:NlpC/P60-like cell-wall peptidase n=1 Tax=Talaromyces proteolyticus TaxID=1131652 RepID=A0AAD4KQE9_9EURO|nr:putative NlpC/P60-like cell-wall peptidase [Talaromyces proteolyticus]KAH8696633.1 putative NlpC/P60-like cell-wall peptidase [Talaromyces proteolyticus]